MGCRRSDWLAVAVFPEVSVAVHAIAVMSFRKVLPLGFRATVTPGQLSDATAIPSWALVTIAGTTQARVTVAGGVIVGGCVSLIVTVKPQDGPAPELAAKVFVVVPGGKKDPEG